jgi:tryptophan synthase alpha chain
MPAAEAGELRVVCDEAGIALIPLVAPTTPADEVRRIAESARGFVYVVSVTGVTGERAALPPELGDVVERVREAADVPVAVGFGVGTPEQVAAVAAIADGVIVGSRLVRGVMDAPTTADALADVRAFLSDSVRAL